MDPTPGAEHKRQVVATALRDQRPDFEAFVRSRVPAQQVDDVVQLAALRAMERAETLEQPDRVVAWLYRIHRNVIIDALRKLARERSVFDDVDVAPERVDPPAGDPCNCSVALAERINPSYASILTLVDSGGATLHEAAHELDVTVNNAAVRLHRARQALRREMLEHCGVRSPRECGSCRCVYEDCCAA